MTSRWETLKVFAASLLLQKDGNRVRIFNPKRRIAIYAYRVHPDNSIEPTFREADLRRKLTSRPTRRSKSTK